jgi:hypothetical protein
MHIEDLAPYRYNSKILIPNVYAVGWLDRAHPFQTGRVSAHLIDKLNELAATRPVNRARGTHQCTMCSLLNIEVSAQGASRSLGSAELWIPGKDGVLFASPNLILHYVRNHSYLPPTDFLRALDALDLNSWYPSIDLGLDLFRKTLEMK